MRMIKQAMASFLIFLAFDFIWLGFIVKSFNLQQLQQIGRIKDGEFDVQLTAALIVYLLMVLSVTIFLAPKIKGRTISYSFVMGAVMGFCIYGIFDMTNMAILESYPLQFAVVDMAWGTMLYGFTAMILTRFSKQLN